MPGEIRAELDATFIGALESDPHPAAARTRRDWVVDILFLVIALGLGTLNTQNDTPLTWQTLYSVDAIAGYLCSLTLLWRRRFPIGVACLALVASMPFYAPAVASALALFSLAVHRPPRYAVVLGTIGVAAEWIAAAYLRPSQENLLTHLLIAAIGTACIVGWGSSVRSRRQLLLSLVDRARRARSEQAERVAAGRSFERERLAREMHDVLAHRMSMLAVHAGALEFRPDASPEQIARAAGVIRAGVHQMLSDLREVILMLREESDDLAMPRNSLTDVPALIADSRSAGDVIFAQIALSDPDSAPGVTSRAAYRVVQEGLTNARKHAHGKPVTLRVSGEPGRGVEIEIRQTLTTGERTAVSKTLHESGTGTGLIGLSERIALAGGTISYGEQGSTFVLHATLPWE